MARKKSQGRRAGLGLAALAKSDADKRVVADVELTYRRTSSLRSRRSNAIALTWMVTVALGAGVPLATSFDSPSWFVAVLGFGVVVVQGYRQFIESRIGNVVVLDKLVREIDTAARKLRAGRPPFDQEATRFTEFQKAFEKAMEDYNRASNANLKRAFPTTE